MPWSNGPVPVEYEAESKHDDADHQPIEELRPIHVIVGFGGGGDASVAHLRAILRQSVTGAIVAVNARGVEESMRTSGCKIFIRYEDVPPHWLASFTSRIAHSLKFVKIVVNRHTGRSEVRVNGGRGEIIC